MRTALLAVAVVGALASAAAAEDDTSNITMTTAFAMGSFKVADTHGFAAPGGHFDLGFRVRRWRLAAEAEFGPWFDNDKSGDVSRGGSFGRLGMALQWSFKDLLVPPNDNRPKAAHFIGYVEAGLGRQHVDGDFGTFGRNDVMLGMGMTPELRLGPAVFGADFGVRVLISRAPVTTIARGSSSSEPGLDVALLYVLGLRFGH